MKKLVLAFIGVSVITITFAQKINVPAEVSKAFAAKFPNATEVKWGKENAKEYEAEFKINNVPVSANFGTDGSWKETETTIKASELPAEVTKSVNTKYPGAEYSVCERIEKPGNKLMYEVNIKVKGKKKELEFNPDGSIAK